MSKILRRLDYSEIYYIFNEKQSCFQGFGPLSMKKLLKTVKQLLFDQERFPALFRILAALIAGTMLLFKPFAAVRLLSPLSWGFVIAAVLVLFLDGRNSPRKRGRYYFGALAAALLGALLLMRVRGDYLASGSIGIWTLLAGAGFLQGVRRPGLPDVDRGFRLGEGVLTLALGAFFLCRFDRSFIESAPLYALTFFAVAAITAASTRWKRNTI